MISDVTMQSVNVTSVPVCRSVCKNHRKTFFYKPSTLLRRTVNVCKLRVLCHDVCNIAPPTCISVNYVKIPLNFDTLRLGLMFIKLLFCIKLCNSSVLMLLYRM